jgi:hypothetical protein
MMHTDVRASPDVSFVDKHIRTHLSHHLHPSFIHPLITGSSVEQDFHNHVRDSSAESPPLSLITGRSAQKELQ